MSEIKVGDKVKYNNKNKIKPCSSETQMRVFFSSILGEMLIISKIDGVACEFENCGGIWFLSDFELVENKGYEKIKELITKSLAPIIASNVVLENENKDLKQRIEKLERERLSNYATPLQEFIDKALGSVKLEQKVFPEPVKEELKQLDAYHDYGWCIIGDFKGLYKELKQFNPIPEKDDYNCFRTEQSAEQARKHLQITCALLNFRAENDKEYNETGFANCFIDLVTKATDRFTLDIQPIGAVMFSSYELAQSALDMLKQKGLV